MNVSFNPAVSFKSNIIEEKLSGMQPAGTIDGNVTNPVQTVNIAPQPETDEFVQKRGSLFEAALKDKDWDKQYIPKADIVHVYRPNMKDGTEYEISPDGKVMAVSGWSNPEVVYEPNEKMAAYFNEIKSANKDVSASDAKESASDVEIQEKAKEFKDHLKSRKWKKEYFPESDLIFIKEKKSKDGVEYILEKDGTIKEVGMGKEPTVVIEANSEFAKEFGKIKSKQSGKADKPSLWYRIKDTIADTWKFFSMAGTMAAATAKGVFYGAATGLGVIGASVLLKGPSALKAGAKVLDILKNPLRTAGTTGKVVAGIAGTLVLVSNIVKGKLQANENTAVIEHKFNVDHRNKVA